jgi:hypothetical protein
MKRKIYCEKTNKNRRRRRRRRRRMEERCVRISNVGPGCGKTAMEVKEDGDRCVSDEARGLALRHCNLDAGTPCERQIFDF